MDLLKDKTVEKYFSSITSINTKKVYLSGLKMFFSSVGVSPEDYFKVKRDYESDIKKLFVKLSENGRPPKTVRTYLFAVKGYLMDNDIEFKQMFWRKISRRVKGNKARTLDEVPADASTLRKLFTHMDVKGRSLFLVLTSSGMRIGESLQIKLGDLDLDKEPAWISIRGENSKNGDSRICFISAEAKESLQEWLGQREKWLKGAISRGNGLGVTKSLEDDRVFPITENVALTIWKNALEKAGLVKRDPSTNRRTLHPHVLRKYFRTKLGKVNVDFAETIMGHAGYLTDAYRRYGVEEVAKFYLENQHLLYVFTDASELSRLRGEVDKRIDYQNKMIESILLEKVELQSKMNKLIEEKVDLVEGLNNLMSRMDRMESQRKKEKTKSS